MCTLNNAFFLAWIVSESWKRRRKMNVNSTINKSYKNSLCVSQYLYCTNLRCLCMVGVFFLYHRRIYVCNSSVVNAVLKCLPVNFTTCIFLLPEYIFRYIRIYSVYKWFRYQEKCYIILNRRGPSIFFGRWV